MMILFSLYACTFLPLIIILHVHAGKKAGLFGGDVSRPTQSSAEGQFRSPGLQIGSVGCAVFVCELCKQGFL